MSKPKGSATTRTLLPASRPVGRLAPSNRYASTGPVHPAQSTRPGASSTSWRWASTAPAVHPSRWAGASVWLTVWAIWAARSTWAVERNMTARSGPGPSRSSTSPTTSPTAVAASGCPERATA